MLKLSKDEPGVFADTFFEKLSQKIKNDNHKMRETAGINSLDKAWKKIYALLDEIEATKKSGFEPIPEKEICAHPEHNPPTGLCIPHGQQYRHICPQCGKKVVCRGSHVTF